MIHITTKEFKDYLAGKKTKNRKHIEKILKGGDKQNEDKRRSL